MFFFLDLNGFWTAELDRRDGFLSLECARSRGVKVDEVANAGQASDESIERVLLSAGEDSEAFQGHNDARSSVRVVLCTCVYPPARDEPTASRADGKDASLTGGCMPSRFPLHWRET